MIEVGRWTEYKRVTHAIFNQFDDVPVLACFGNDEQEMTVQSARELVGESITFLDGGTCVISAGKMKLGVLGVPLFDSARNTHNGSFDRIIRRRVGKMRRGLEDLRTRCERVILLMHYSPLTPEAFPATFSWWLSCSFERVRPDMIIHGHIHYATNPNVMMHGIKIVNVAFPATREIMEIVIESAE